MKRSLKKGISFLAALSLLAGVPALAGSAAAAGEVKLYTPYTSLSAAPGESISYTIDLLNESADIQTVNVSFDDGGHGWTAELTSGGHPVQQIAVKPEDSQTLNLRLEVPLEVDKGAYGFRVSAGSFGELPLRVNVTEQGTYKTELTTDQPNMQGHSDTSFSYSLTLNNRTAGKQTYALSAEVPPGWDARFTSGGNNVTSVDVDPNGTQSISLALTPAENAAAETYPITVRATNNSTSAEAKLEAVITGTYSLQLTTSDERLSTDITAGGERNMELVLKNDGSAELTDVSLTSTAPANWEVTFEPKTIRSIKPGSSVPVTATIKSSKESLAGDYVLNITASSDEKSASAVIRATVNTSVLWGWVGVLIILAVLGGVYALFRKYGRR